MTSSEECPREHSRRLVVPVHGKPKDTFRYLFFRLREVWPACLAVDEAGDSYTPDASVLPEAAFILPHKDAVLTYQLFRRAPAKLTVQTTSTDISIEADAGTKSGIEYLAQLPLIRERASIEEAL